jgi:NAD(P)-dependent dehydrogenase (short-subunit alcohol dehydrogenase family)
MLLKNKVVIVSGVGPGLGQELAYAAAREGADVVLAARTRSFLEQVANEVEKRGRRALVVSTDVSDAAQCRSLVGEAVDVFGRVDVLVNSAYTAGSISLFEDADLDDWRRTMEVNLFGALALTQACVSSMKQNGGGSVVMVNTMVQKKPLPYQAGYGTSKGAMSAATRMLAKELGPHGIRVNQVYMGWMWGPNVQNFIEFSAKSRGVSPEQVIEEITKEIPLGVIPDDADCANAVIFFASDLSRVITGASLDVNGGEFMP